MTRRLLLSATVLLVVVLGSLALGAGGIEGMRDAGILDSRISRTVVGLVVGAAVGVAGAALQGVTRNPLADPGLLGINAGAALAVVLGIQLLGLSSPREYVWVALLGALGAAGLVYGIAASGPGGPRPLTLALAGAAVAALVSSVTAGLLIADTEALDTFRFWQVGSVAGRDASVLYAVFPLLVPGLLVTLLAGRSLDTLSLGDELARGLGQRIQLTRFLVVLGAVAISAAATAIAGPIAFVGLVVPHLVRLLVGAPASTVLLVGSAVGGGTLLVLADTVGRVVAPPTEIQAGIITALLGAPALLLLVRRSRVTVGGLT